MSEVVARDDYSSLHRHLLSVVPESEWRTAFGELEAILGYRPPDSARPRRPLWPDSKVGIGHRYLLAWQAAGWRAREVGVEEEMVEAERREAPPEPAALPARRRFSIGEILPPHDPGSWPQGFTVSREQIHDDMGRLTGGSEDLPEDGR